MRIPSLLFVRPVIAACGAKDPKLPTIPEADAGAGGNGGGASPIATSPPPAGLPPMAQMPPPGAAGSKKAKKKSDGNLFACGGGSKPTGKDPAEVVKRVGESCAAASKMKPMGPPFKGPQGDKDPHAEHKFRVEANKCYRVYFATDEGVKDAVALVRDSAGDMVADSNGTVAVPHDGAMCFTQADEVTLLIGIGTGKGTYVAQIWSD
jgi:hypothetical protein